MGTFSTKFTGRRAALVLAMSAAYVAHVHGNAADARTLATALGAAARQDGDSISKAIALATFDTAWSRIRALHYDSAMNGIDWPGVRTELRPRAEAARTNRELRAVISDMLHRLGESHYVLIPREASAGFMTDSGTAGSGMPGDVGVELRIQHDWVLVARVDSGSPAFVSGVRAGWIVKRAGALDADSLIAAITRDGSVRGRRERRLRGTMRLNGALRGEIGSTVTLVVVDARGKESTLALTRSPARGVPVKYGSLPTTMARVQGTRTGSGSRCTGVLRFNTWMVPVAAQLDSLVDALRHCRGMVIDLRGNTGGVASMVTGFSGHFLQERDTLGVMRTRNAQMHYVANPRRSNARGERVEPYSGKLAILVDDLTASTSEIFVAAFKSLGRARVFGDSTAGQALPATLHRLPNHDVLMLAVADFRGRNGERIEGHGIIPDVIRIPTREELLRGRDPVLEAALGWISGGLSAREMQR